MGVGGVLLGVGGRALRTVVSVVGISVAQAAVGLAFGVSTALSVLPIALPYVLLFTGLLMIAVDFDKVAAEVGPSATSFGNVYNDFVTDYVQPVQRIRDEIFRVSNKVSLIFTAIINAATQVLPGPELFEFADASARAHDAAHAQAAARARARIIAGLSPESLAHLRGMSPEDQAAYVKAFQADTRFYAKHAARGGAARHFLQTRIAVNQALLDALATAVTAVADFLLAVLTLVSELVLAVLDALLQVVDIATDGDVSFGIGLIRAIVELIIDAILDLIPFAKCATPFNEFIPRSFTCACPHRFKFNGETLVPFYIDLGFTHVQPSNDPFINAVLCVVPLVDASPDDVSNPLEFLIDAIGLGPLYDAAETAVSFVYGVLKTSVEAVETSFNVLKAQFDNLKSIFKGFEDRLKFICAGFCRDIDVAERRIRAGEGDLIDIASVFQGTAFADLARGTGAVAERFDTTYSLYNNTIRESMRRMDGPTSEASRSLVECMRTGGECLAQRRALRAIRTGAVNATVSGVTGMARAAERQIASAAPTIAERIKASPILRNVSTIITAKYGEKGGEAWASLVRGGAGLARWIGRVVNDEFGMRTQLAAAALVEEADLRGMVARHIAFARDMEASGRVKDAPPLARRLRSAMRALHAVLFDEDALLDVLAEGAASGDAEFAARAAEDAEGIRRLVRAVAGMPAEDAVLGDEGRARVRELALALGRAADASAEHARAVEASNDAMLRALSERAATREVKARQQYEVSYTLTSGAYVPFAIAVGGGAALSAGAGLVGPALTYALTGVLVVFQVGASVAVSIFEKIAEVDLRALNYVGKIMDAVRTVGFRALRDGFSAVDVDAIFDAIIEQVTDDIEHGVSDILYRILCAFPLGPLGGSASCPPRPPKDPDLVGWVSHVFGTCDHGAPCVSTDTTPYNTECEGPIDPLVPDGARREYTDANPAPAPGLGVQRCWPFLAERRYTLPVIFNVTIQPGSGDYRTANLAYWRCPDGFLTCTWAFYKDVTFNTYEAAAYGWRRFLASTKLPEEGALAGVGSFLLLPPFVTAPIALLTAAQYGVQDSINGGLDTAGDVLRAIGSVPLIGSFFDMLADDLTVASIGTPADDLRAVLFGLSGFAFALLLNGILLYVATATLVPAAVLGGAVLLVDGTATVLYAATRLVRIAVDSARLRRAGVLVEESVARPVAPQVERPALVGTIPTTSCLSPTSSSVQRIAHAHLARKNSMPIHADVGGWRYTRHGYSFERPPRLGWGEALGLGARDALAAVPELLSVRGLEDVARTRWTAGLARAIGPVRRLGLATGVLDPARPVTVAPLRLSSETRPKEWVSGAFIRRGGVPLTSHQGYDVAHAEWARQGTVGGVPVAAVHQVGGHDADAKTK